MIFGRGQVRAFKNGPTSKPDDGLDMRNTADMARQSCKVSGCSTEHYARGFCNKHWQRWNKFGDPNVLKKVRIVGSIQYRLFQRRKFINECWVWTGAIEKSGYGNIYYNGRNWKVHRLAYQTFKTKLNDDLTIDHLCRNRACFNPDHLEEISFKENILRGIGPTANNFRKTHCFRGHKLDGNNLIIRKRSGNRKCRLCKNALSQKYKKAAKNGG